jgi:metallo-beta-lactamase family protein
VEELLYWIDRLEEQKRIPMLPVYVDSPMAGAVLQVYRKRPEELDDDMRGSETLSEAMRRLALFSTANLSVIARIEESRRIQESDEPSIVISSSGMATGGRVLHHLARALPNPRHTVLFSGYQAAGTRGRALKDGVKITRIHGQEVPVRARIEAVDSMSAHADSDEIMRWLKGFRRPPAATCLVHGEPVPMDALKARIEQELGWTVKAPAHQERMEI